MGLFGGNETWSTSVWEKITYGTIHRAFVISALTQPMSLLDAVHDTSNPLRTRMSSACESLPCSADVNKGVRSTNETIFTRQAYNTMMASLTHWGWDKMDAISQTTFSSAFSWMKMFEFRLKFHWRLFLRIQLTIFQHWFRKWPARPPSYYLNQWWLIYWCMYALLGLNELICQYDMVPIFRTVTSFVPYTLCLSRYMFNAYKWRVCRSIKGALAYDVPAANKKLWTNNPFTRSSVGNHLTFSGLTQTVSHKISFCCEKWSQVLLIGYYSWCLHGKNKSPCIGKPP